MGFVDPEGCLGPNVFFSKPSTMDAVEDDFGAGLACVLLVNLTYARGQKRWTIGEDLSPPAGALGAFAISCRHTVLDMSFVAWASPANQTEGNWTKDKWTEQPLLSLPHGILQFLWDFEIAFSTFRSPM